MAEKISGSQTAYLKNRLINDNIRAIMSTIKLANTEEDIEGILVSLDAKKAFDSVDHSYIEKCLRSFGFKRFIPIFRTLYKDLTTDIIINGRIVKGFRINRGVKQGDALSCVLFIMCMEPLLRNIEINPIIEKIRSEKLGCSLPKIYAYADDVNCIMKDNDAAMQALFDEYERLTLMSGLELNADKTEVMRLGRNELRTYNVNYKNTLHSINSLREIKINGILFQNNSELMVKSNVENVVRKMDRQFQAWSRRSLSVVGKILIAKTFGVSQAIYLMQSISLKDEHYKKFNAVLYKFIWNRNYQASKAPERVKRDILNNSVKRGGYGMLDIIELDGSLKLRALGRVRSTGHPFLKILNAKLNLDSFFNPKIELDFPVDSVLTEGIRLLKIDRDKLWAIRGLDGDRRLMAAIRATNIKDIIEARGRASIPFFNIWMRGARVVGDLSMQDLNQLSRHIPTAKMHKLKLAIGLNLGPPDPEFNESYYTTNRHKPLNKITSNEIRNSRCDQIPILSFKLGTELTSSESISWGLKLAKLTSARHKNTLLRVSHGDVYTQEKLHRFGMSDSNLCTRCNEIETLKHKIVECDYVKRIWNSARPLINQLQDIVDPNPDPTRFAVAATSGATSASMTLTAEIIQNILFLKPDQTFLLHPRFISTRALRNLAIKEGNSKTRLKFIEVLGRIDDG